MEEFDMDWISDEELQTYDAPSETCDKDPPDPIFCSYPARPSNKNKNYPVPIIHSKIGRDSLHIRTLPPKQIKEMNKLFRSMVGKLVKCGVYYYQGEPYKIRATPFMKGLRKYLTLHKFLGSNHRHYKRIDYSFYAENPIERLSVFKPSNIQLVQLRGKTATIQKQWQCDTPVMPPIMITRDLEPGEWTWIASFKPLNKCPSCGICWTNKHSCKEASTSFYWMSIDKTGREMWQHVRFKCASSPPNNRNLFVTYDIETYTIFTERGKRMYPFMLCFKLSGDPILVQQAEEIAKQDTSIGTINGGYYWIHNDPGVVGRKFRNFRTNLQVYFADDLIFRFFQFNSKPIEALLKEKKLKNPRDLPFDVYWEHRKKFFVPSEFYQVSIIVIGHNICKFDEILLASEIIEDREIYPKATKCERAFMPRAGRLLFNDIYFSLPNPSYLDKDPTRTMRWKRARTENNDYMFLSVKFTVRDTCQLTGGASLRKAAQAYSLNASKGECPYEAINDFLSTGQYKKDEDGFPQTEYWQNETVMLEQKQLWQANHPSQPYDIIHACLEYCMLDVIVTEQLAHTILHNYDVYFKVELGFEGNFNIFERPTIPSNTHALWKQLAFAEYIQEKQSSPLNQLKNIDHRFVAQLYSPHKTMFKYIRQALRGGRCYPTILGPFYKPVYVFDICGMYASALTHPLPHGSPLDPKSTAIHVDILNSILQGQETISYFDSRIKPSILKVEAHPPCITQLDSLPPICSRKGGRLVWTNESLYDEVITVIDIITLHNRGWKVKVIHDPMNVVFREWKTLCAEYVGKNIRAKEKADKEGNEIMRSISKLLSNALYGAFATNMDTTKIIFEQDLSQEDMEKIHFGDLEVNHVTVLNDPSFKKQIAFTENAFSSLLLGRDFNSPWSSAEDEEEEDTRKDQRSLTSSPSLEDIDEELLDLNARPYIPSEEYDHAHFTAASTTRFKPLTLLEAPSEALTILHVEKQDKMVENNRYATQLACFVLGWSRAFFSEWADIVHGPDRGTHPHEREPQSLYGDTDSIFLTESGYKRMITRGAHRIKSPSTQLIFDPKNPQLTWACECDIKCKQCKSDTYSSESIYLAPKLYALKDSHCTKCGFVGQGKLRAKGHPGEELIYDTLMRCWQRSEEEAITGTSSIPELNTSRTIFKKTLLNKVSKYDPFTLHNERLTRVLRPWKDITLYQHGDYLYPYNNANPNPRNELPSRQLEDFSGDDPLQPLTGEDCDILLDFIKENDGNQEEALEL
ncbi:DNA polymerase [Goose adenovirus 4]|uniref:DNA polymerase n=2 Tax=Aviadenovirus TaxID=10552 RepID=I3PMM6_9ADEN|nr:DNA polymerase [Goose adenovirus 4]AFC40566.1 DNA polymerase [Goose adenovirus 4]